MEDILKTKDVNKSFGGLTALNNVDVNIKKQKIIGLIGPNGSGKSTLFNVITNVFAADRDDPGEIFYKGKKINEEKTHKIAQRGLIRTFQTTQIFPKLTVLENMMIAAQNHPGERMSIVLIDVFKKLVGKSTWEDQESQFAETAMKLLDFLEISHLAHEKAEVLSGGQRKLLALGRSLMASGDMILLDEPVAGVNPSLSNRIFDKINTIREEGTTFFLVEHNMDVIMQSSDTIIVLNKGEVIAVGTPDEIQKNPKVLEAYLGTTVEE